MSSLYRILQVKHEAETYLSQGLHQEALVVFEKFLAEARDLQPSVKSDILQSIYRIRSDARKGHQDEAELMSDVEIILIKKGWQGQATDEERLASAQTLLGLHLYQFALEEYRRLLKRRFISVTVIRGVALCLVNLVRPKQFKSVVEHFAEEIFKHPHNRRALILGIAKQIDSKYYPRHFSALSRHISRTNLESTKSLGSCKIVNGK